MNLRLEQERGDMYSLPQEPEALGTLPEGLLPVESPRRGGDKDSKQMYGKCQSVEACSR